MVKNIILGWYRFLFKKNTKYDKTRLEICKKCEFNENNWCGVCGCYIPAKVKVENEICHMNKWNDNE